MTPVAANTAIGIIATVLAFTPVTLSSNQKRIVTMKVTITTVVRQLCWILPSIFSSIVFFLNGKKRKSNHQPMMSRISVIGTIYNIHSPKPMLRFMPSGSFRYFNAIMLGGVPIGVPIPPMLAPNGIAIVSATRPLPSAGSALNTGAKKVSIIAAVAVLLMNMENKPVMRIKPNSTTSLFFPKGLSR